MVKLHSAGMHLVKQINFCLQVGGGLYNFGNGSYESYESYERYESYESLAKINFGNESYGDFILVR